MKHTATRKIAGLWSVFITSQLLLSLPVVNIDERRRAGPICLFNQPLHGDGYGLNETS